MPRKDHMQNRNSLIMSFMLLIMESFVGIRIEKENEGYEQDAIKRNIY